MSVPANKQVICEVLKEAVRRDPGIVVLCSDSRGSGSMTSFFEEYPDNSVEVGIADKTPGLDLRLKADAEFRKAAESAGAAEDVYWKILNGLPSEQKDTPYTAALREHVSDRIARIRLLLHDL